jgi:uncharacterized phage protein gp47/JayE
LVVPEFSVVSSTGEAVLFDVTNPSASTAGADQESVESARINAPASLAAGNRSVNAEDYVTNARRVSGIARGLMLTSDQYVGMDENYGQLHLVGKGSTTASGKYNPTDVTQAKLDEVKNLITSTYPPTITFRFDVLSATFNTIDVTARVYLQEGANATTVDTAIRSNLANYFACLDENETPTTTVDFGYNLKNELGAVESLVPWGDIFTTIKNTTGVRRVDEDAFTPVDDVVLLVKEFPKLGTVTLVNARTGLPLV